MKLFYGCVIICNIFNNFLWIKCKIFVYLQHKFNAKLCYWEQCLLEAHCIIYRHQLNSLPPGKASKRDHYLCERGFIYYNNDTEGLSPLRFV